MRDALNEVCSVVRRYVIPVGLVSIVSALSGCGGSGPASGLGEGQNPDPVVQDFPVAYVKRILAFDEDGDPVSFDVRDPSTFTPGAALFMRDRASVSADELNLTAGVFPDDDEGNPPLYDVKDVSVSADGALLTFAMRAPEDPNLDDDEQPKWNIWVYELETATLRRVITSDIVAEDGHDIGPRFLPDGRIVFASTRQRQAKAILLDEGKPQFSNFDEDRDNEAFVIHVMDDDGMNIRQVTFNQSHDLDPSVLDDGRIVFSRWDNVANNDRISLYSMNPDGTDMQVLYGVHSHDTGPNGETVEFLEAQELPDGRMLVMLRTSAEQTHLGAFPIAIDTANYVEHDEPTFQNAGLIARSAGSPGRW